MASRMYDSGRKLVIAGIQHGKPSLTAPQLRGQVFLRMYGGDFTVEERKSIIRQIPNMELDADLHFPSSVKDPGHGGGSGQGRGSW
jgi:hypothetical protein